METYNILPNKKLNIKLRKIMISSSVAFSEFQLMQWHA